MNEVFFYGFEEVANLEGPIFRKRVDVDGGKRSSLLGWSIGFVVVENRLFFGNREFEYLVV